MSVIDAEINNIKLNRLDNKLSFTTTSTIEYFLLEGQRFWPNESKPKASTTSTTPEVPDSLANEGYVARLIAVENIDVVVELDQLGETYGTRTFEIFYYVLEDISGSGDDDIQIDDGNGDDSTDDGSGDGSTDDGSGDDSTDDSTSDDTIDSNGGGGSGGGDTDDDDTTLDSDFQIA